MEVSALELAYNEAELLFIQGLYDEAIVVYKTIIDYSEFSTKAHWARLKIAYIYQKINRLDMARDIWDFFAKTNQLAIFDGIAQEMQKRLS